jgi:ATP synthase subunit 6
LLCKFFFSPLEQFNAVVLVVLKHCEDDISITSILLPLFIANMLLFFIIEFYIRGMKLVPELWQLFLENLYAFVLDILEQQVGYKGFVYFPLIFSLFFFILTCNLISMTPYGIALTSHIIMIILLSLSLGLSMFIIGLYIHNLEFLKIFIPECPFLLLPFLIVIEIFSYIIRSFSLAIRLSANIMAGHTLVYIISSFILNMVYIKFWFFFFLVFLILAVLLLEVGVAFLQAYVFTILVCIYLSDSLKTPSH